MMRYGTKRTESTTGAKKSQTTLWSRKEVRVKLA
jgi:hypothetical protein